MKNLLGFVDIDLARLVFVNTTVAVTFSRWSFSPCVLLKWDNLE